MDTIVISGSQQNGIEEKLIRPIAEKLHELLQADNLVKSVLLPLYSGNDEQALYQAIQASNAINPDYHLAIHADAGGYARGASGLYFSENGKRFIAPITHAIENETPWPDVGTKKRVDLGELKNTTAVAGLIELSFYDNSEELKWMQNNMELIATTLKNGIYSALNINQGIDYQKKYNDLRNGIIALINT
jgi:N-acetylmuramoyl-L-alanine amidase